MIPLITLCKEYITKLDQNSKRIPFRQEFLYFLPKSTKMETMFSFQDKKWGKGCKDDKCHRVWDICHYKMQPAFVNIISMFRQDFAQLSLFEGLHENQISQLTLFMVECHYQQNEIIFEQGQRADHLYILLSGEVMVNYKPYDGPPLTVARIEKGGVFGWSAALGRDIYTSGAVAIEDCIAYRVRGENLALICEQHPDTGMILLDRLASVIAERLRSTHTQVLGILSQGIDVDGNCMSRRIKNDRKYV